MPWLYTTATVLAAVSAVAVARLDVVDLELGVFVQQYDKSTLKLLLVTHHVVEFVKTCSGKQETRPAPPQPVHATLSMESEFVSPE